MTTLVSSRNCNKKCVCRPSILHSPTIAMQASYPNQKEEIYLYAAFSHAVPSSAAYIPALNQS